MAIVSESPLTFRITLEESMFAVLTHYGTREEEGAMAMDERVDGRL